MLTEDEIFLAIDNVPITQKYVVSVAHAIEQAVLAKLRARLHPCQFCDATPGTQHGRHCRGFSGVVGGEVLRDLVAGAADARIPEQKGESVQAYVQAPTGKASA